MKILLLDFGHHQTSAFKAKFQAEGDFAYIVSLAQSKLNSINKQFLDNTWDIVLICGANSNNRLVDAAVYLRSISNIPLLAIIQNASANVMTRLLHTGVDDGVRGKIDYRELRIRVQKLKERRSHCLFHNNVLQIGEIDVHLTKKEVTIQSKPISLTKTEYKIFLYLLFHAQNLVHKKELQFHTFKRCSDTSHTLNMHISRLRKKIESIGSAVEIKTVSTAGFKLVA